ncbi:MAG: TonB-dependent receptor plug domain-containing protein, partial [Chitinophagaceae bacterium]|nr:TonB-dependent receptor plug domain-containing protein [Chitinophagaceae bacterium]
MKKIIFLLIGLCYYSISFSQNIAVNGVVTDAEDNSPLEGATITIRGTKNSALSDKDGKFTIKAKLTDGLQVSFTGYETRIFGVNGKALIVIKLKKVSDSLDDVVVVGYSSIRKKDIAGSSSFLGEKDIKRANVLSAAEAIQGRVPGVQVISSDGSPGGGITLNLRGNNSILAGTTPLLVIDGIPFVPPIEAGFNPFAIVSPDDIESITVLKDASSTAQYGSEAANGVILITTKKGKMGKPKVNLNIRTSVGKLV